MSSPRSDPPRPQPTAKPDWRTLALCALMYLLLAGNAALYFSARLPIALHFAVSVLAIHLAFTIWHEAAHGTVLRGKLGNNIVGVIAMFPYMTPFFMQKWIHIEHHRKLNEEADPNLIYLDGSFITIPLRYLRALSYARQVLASDPRSSST